MAGATRSLGRAVKRVALSFLGLTGFGTAVAGSLLTISASHACTLAPTGTACYPSSTKVFLGVALLVCGLGVLEVALLKVMDRP